MISVGRLAEFSTLTNATAPKSSEQASAQKTTTMASDNSDKFVRSETTFAPAYTRATVTENSAGRTRDDEAADKKELPEKNKEELKTDENAHSGASTEGEKSKSRLMFDYTVRVITRQANDAIQPAPANELEEILRSYRGEETPREVAERLLAYAKSLCAAPADIAEVKSGFVSAFGECGKLYEGDLPQQCYETYRIVVEGLEKIH